MSVTRCFVNTATRTTYTIGVDSSNGSATRSGPTASTFACSLQSRSSSEGLDYGRDASRKQAVLYYGNTVTLVPEDLITLGSDVYRVVGNPRDVAGRGVYFEADLEATSGGGSDGN